MGDAVADHIRPALDDVEELCEVMPVLLDREGPFLSIENEGLYGEIEAVLLFIQRAHRRLLSSCILV